MRLAPSGIFASLILHAAIAYALTEIAFSSPKTEIPISAVEVVAEPSSSPAAPQSSPMEQDVPPPSSPPLPPRQSQASAKKSFVASAQKTPQAAKPMPHAASVPESPPSFEGSSSPAQAESVGETTPPHYILGSDYTPHPDYPWSARRRGREGVVVLRLDVASTGEVLQTSILQSSGEPVLDQAATQALSRWRLTPARENGKPVAATITVPIRFVLG